MKRQNTSTSSYMVLLPRTRPAREAGGGSGSSVFRHGRRRGAPSYLFARVVHSLMVFVCVALGLESKATTIIFLRTTFGCSVSEAFVRFALGMVARTTTSA